MWAVCLPKSTYIFVNWSRYFFSDALNRAVISTISSSTSFKLKSVCNHYAYVTARWHGFTFAVTQICVSSVMLWPRDVISILSYSTVHKLDLKSRWPSLTTFKSLRCRLEMTLPWKCSVRKEEWSSPRVALSSLIREMFLLHLLRCLALKQVSCSVQHLFDLQQFQETKSYDLWVRMCLWNCVQLFITPHLHIIFIDKSYVCLFHFLFNEFCHLYRVTVNDVMRRWKQIVGAISTSAGIGSEIRVWDFMFIRSVILGLP
jgi:hypothetical protein